MARKARADMDEKELYFNDLFSQHTGLNKKQKTFLKAYDARLLNTTAAAKIAGVSRAAVYQWIDKLDSFKNAKIEIEENFYDSVETAIFSKAVVEKDNTMLIFLAKSKMKERGYIERTEVTGKHGEQVIPNLQIEIIDKAEDIRLDDTDD